MVGINKEVRIGMVGYKFMGKAHSHGYRRDDIDLIDIVTPNNTHAEIAIAAAEARKHVYCEKPLAMTLEESKRMLEAVQKNNVIHMVN